MQCDSTIITCADIISIVIITIIIIMIIIIIIIIIVIVLIDLIFGNILLVFVQAR